MSGGAVELPLLHLPVHLPSVLVWGLVATVILTGMMYLGQELGISRMGIPFLLGAMFTRNRRWAKVGGFGIHLLNGWIFALVYALLFQSVGAVSWWIGAGFGLIHGLLLLTLGMQFLPLLHPRVATEREGPDPTRWLQPPGFLAMHYGRRTPLVALVAHLVYGTILGATYALV